MAWAPTKKRILITALLTTFITTPTFAQQKQAQRSLPLDDLQRFTTVVENIKNYYVTPTDDKTLFENAIRGMLAGLDPHSAYLDTKEFNDLKVSTSGKFGGLGIEVTMEDGFVKVISPIDETPAQRAGIQPGDMIIKLDETPVKGLSLRDAVNLMRGERGTDIKLTVIRSGESKPLVIPVTRDIIKVQSVKSELLENHYGYIRISQFQTRTGEDLIAAVDKLKEDSKGKLKGLILDLRNNPGGILEASVKVSDAFLDKSKIGYDGKIVYTKGRLPGSQLVEEAHNGDILNDAPIIVMVNGGSASASEIVAGALQDHKRALIVGTSSFGKGSVQTVLPLKDNYGLKLTTALYYTPKGLSIQAKGIQPDIIVKNLKLAEQQDDSLNIMAVKEKDLTGHIVTDPETIQKALSSEGIALVNKDYQLNEALNLLKGLVLVKGHRS